MKKLRNLILLVIIMCVSFVKVANADSITLKGEKEFSGDSFTIEVVASVKDKIAAVRLFDFKYDSTKLGTIKYEDANGWGKTASGEKILIEARDLADEKNGTFTTVKLTFAVTDSFKVGEEVTISFSKAELVNTLDKLWETDGSSITIKRVAQTTDSGNNGTQDIESNNGTNNNQNNSQNNNQNNNQGGANNSSQDDKVTNPDTGISVPITIFIVAIASVGAIVLRNKFSKQLYKL